jgi:hypothetical protein
MLTLISSLVPAIRTDGQLALDPLQEKVHATHLALLAVRVTHGDERLARIDAKKLQPRIKADLYPVVGRVRHLAVELRQSLDHTELSVDIRESVRACVAARSDGEFTAATQSLKKAVDRYAGSVASVEALVAQLDAAIATLVAAETIWSETFVVAAPVGQTWTAAS